MSSSFLTAANEKPKRTKEMLLGRLKPATTCLLICDVQEKFRAAIHKFPTGECWLSLLSLLPFSPHCPLLSSDRRRS